MISGMSDPQPRIATFTQLDTATLYALLRLRVDVFVVEQECPYPELDGRDTEPGTRHLWIDGERGEPVAYLRVLEDPDGRARIGRVTTARRARGTGQASRLMEAAIEVIGDRPAMLDAQTTATGLYARYGFVADGEEFVEDGIPHVSMVRPSRA